MSVRRPVLVRTYKGRTQDVAVAKFRADAERLAKEGYRPSSQSWASGSYGCGAFLVALVLAVILVGILIFIYMLLVKPEGTLTVTYEGHATRQPASAIGLADDLTKLADLRDRGVLTEEEFATRKKQMLER